MADISVSTLARTAIALAAIATPTLLAYNVAPSPTFLNQALALGLWGVWLALAQPAWPLRRGVGPLLAALALLMGTALVSWGNGGLPAGLAGSGFALLLAAALVSTGGAGAHARGDALPWFTAFCWALLITGALNLGVAAVQVFMPQWTGDWIATSGIPGRAVGNLRQPNHLSSLLLWSCIAVVALQELRRLTLRWAVLAMAALVFAVVLTASRTGLVSVLLLGLWGLVDRRLSKPTRALLLAAPLMYALAWWGMAQWASASAHDFGGTARLAESDISGSRFGIWKNTWALILAQPWTGVGFGQFNFAWTLTPFPGRPTAFFDHTHNLPLQLAVELGLPLAGLIMGLLLWALGRAAWLAWRAQGDASTAQRCAVMMVLMIGLHSLLEYPLWYSYFLLPTAWAFGFALRGVPPSGLSAEPARPWLSWAAWALLAGAIVSVWDYGRVAAIFSAEPGSPPLERRIASGQRSVFFAHHADYAAVTSNLAQADPARAFDRTTHYLLDTRLMMAWAKSLAERGDLDAARTLAARLREFDKADAEDFFDACPVAAQPAAAGLPFQCELPTTALGWTEFLPHK